MIFSALKPVILRDSDSFRQTIFTELRSQSRTVRFAEKLFLQSPPAIRSWLLLAYGLKSFLDAPPLTTNISCVYAYENEKKRFEYLKKSFGNRHLDFCKTTSAQWLPEKVLGLMNHISELPRLLRLLKFISARFDFLVSCRISSTIFYYSWFKAEISLKRPEAVLLSSEANPYAMALLWAAKGISVPTIYVPHGQVSPHPPRLFFDLCLLDGEELKSTFEERGPISGRIIFKGTDGEFVPLKTEGFDSPRTVGVFLSLIYNPEELEKVIRQISHRFPYSAILIRLHPNESVSSSEILGRLKDLNIVINRGQTLEEEIRGCDIIFCGNSGTHLEALRQGVPTVQIPGLDSLPHDTRRFIQNRVVAWFSDASSVNAEELGDFYDTNWAERMKKYDYFYGSTNSLKEKILQKEINDWFKARSVLPDNGQRRPDKRI